MTDTRHAAARRCRNDRQVTAAVRALADAHEIEGHTQLAAELRRVPVGGGAHRVRNVVERGHDAVAGVLDLAPAVGGAAAPEERVVRPHKL